LFAAEHRYKIFFIFREEEDKTKTKNKKNKTNRISKNPKAVKTPDS
jgi:hypothetical protein